MNRDHVRGATLFEMLIVLTIAMLLLALAAPSLRFGGGRNDLRWSAQKIASLLREARTRAIKVNREVAVAVQLKERRITGGSAGAAGRFADTVAARGRAAG